MVLLLGATFLSLVKKSTTAQTLRRGRRQNRRPHAPELASATLPMLAGHATQQHGDDLYNRFLFYHSSHVTLTFLFSATRCHSCPAYSPIYSPVPHTRYKFYQPTSKTQNQKHKINNKPEKDADDTSDTAAVTVDDDGTDNDNNDNDDNASTTQRTTMTTMPTILQIIHF